MTNDERRIAAIKARINGVWDNPYLLEIGPIGSSLGEDVLRILEHDFSPPKKFTVVGTAHLAVGFDFTTFAKTKDEAKKKIKDAIYGETLTLGAPDLQEVCVDSVTEEPDSTD